LTGEVATYANADAFDGLTNVDRLAIVVIEQIDATAGAANLTPPVIGRL
jgi:hypothetical protein